MQKKKILILGSHLFGHDLPLLGILQGFIDKNYDIDYCISEEFKEKVSKLPANFIFYPSEAMIALHKDIHQKVPKFPVFDVLRASKFIFNMNLAMTRVVVPWALETLKPESYALVIADSFDLWAYCLVAKWKLPLIISSSTFIFPKSQIPILDDEESLKMVKEFNEQFGTRWETISEVFTCSQGEQIILYTSKYFHIYNQFLQDDQCLFTAKTSNSVYVNEKKKFGPGSLIYFSLGTLFNKDKDLHRRMVTALGNFKKYKVLYGFGGAKEILEEIEKENHSENIEMVLWTDQQKVLQTASLFITHGGFGSVREGAQTITPMILMPQAADQHLVAGRVKELGAGLVLDNEATVEDIIKAIEEIEKNYDLFADGAKKIQDSYIKSLDSKDLVMKIEEHFKI